jgi:hypothetical protein
LKYPAATENGVRASGNAGTPQAAPSIAQRYTSVITRTSIAASPPQVWRSLMFYEQIEESPPLHLRLLLPLPIGAEGSKLAVGDQATCLYKGGHLLKHVTQIDPCRHYEFTVVEQTLVIGRGVLLCGGCYTLSELPGRRTELAVTTRYVSSKGPRWLRKPIEATVCHLFHRHLLSAIQSKAESG